MGARETYQNVYTATHKGLWADSPTQFDLDAQDDILDRLRKKSMPLGPAKFLWVDNATSYVINVEATDPEFRHLIKGKDSDLSLNRTASYHRVVEVERMPDDPGIPQGLHKLLVDGMGFVKLS